MYSPAGVCAHMHFASGSWTAQPLKPSSTLTRHLAKCGNYLLKWHHDTFAKSNMSYTPKMGGSCTNSHSLAKNPAQQLSTKGVPGESIFNKAGTSSYKGTTWRKMLWDTMFHWTEIVGRVWTKKQSKGLSHASRSNSHRLWLLLVTPMVPT